MKFAPFASKIVLFLATAATAATPLASAQAGDWTRHRDRNDGYRVIIPNNNLRDSGQVFGSRGAIYQEDGGHRTYVRRHHRPDYGHRYVYRHRHRDNSDAIALGVLGLAAGAIIGGAIANQEPVYRSTPQRVIRYSGGIEPWTDGWYDYCSARYRSFNARTGTYRGYDGRDHFCVAN